MALTILNYSKIFEFSKPVFWSIFGRNIPRKMKWFVYQKPAFKKSISILVKYPDIKIKKKKLMLLVPQSSVCNLTLSWRMPLSYRNQSIDLRSKSMDWFLYDNGLRHERVKQLIRNRNCKSVSFLCTDSY